MWWCLLLGIGVIGLVVALIYFNHKRQGSNEYDAIEPMTLKLGASGVLILISVPLFSIGAFGALLSIVPLFILGLLWAGPLVGWFSGGAIDSLMGAGQEVEPKPLYSIAETK